MGKKKLLINFKDQNSILFKIQNFLFLFGWENNELNDN